MKKIIYLVITASILSFYSCGGSEKKVGENKTENNYSDTTENKPKHLAFLSDSLRKLLEENKEAYKKFTRDFEIVPPEKFQEYRDSFASLFKIPPPTNTSNHYLSLPFTIYEKYNDFQMKRNLRLPEFTDQGTGNKYTNIVRVYPAIDVSNNFYLVLLRERKFIPNGPVSSIPHTDLDTFYSIKYGAPFGETNASFSQIPYTDTVQTKADIRQFQRVFKSVIDANKKWTFNNDRSFSYSIQAYDKLLSSDPWFWNVDSEKTTVNSTVTVRIFPGLDMDNKGNIKFRLMMKLYTLSGSTYTEVAGKAIFDNMDPCPNSCPEGTSDIIM